jgi:hypothetical protein
LLKGQGALKILTAVESAAKDEMAFQERAGIAKNLQHFIFGHG